MKKTILLTLFALSCMVFAQESGSPQLTPLTREFNRATTAAAARGVIGAASSGSGGALTNAVIYGSTSGSVTFGATANATFSGGKTITTDTGALALTTGAANGNISLTPHGTGYTLLGGNVGIGTATPNQKLTVSGTSEVKGRIESTSNTGTRDAALELFVNNQGSNDPAGSILFKSLNASSVERTAASIVALHGSGSASESLLKFSMLTGGTLTEQMRITSTGNVGIGTTAPDKALEINSATGANLRLTYNDSNGSAAAFSDFSVSSGGVLTIAPTTSTTTPTSVLVTGKLATTATSVTIAAAAATFAITSNVVTVTGDAGANTVTTITGGVSGQMLTLIFADGLVTITDDAGGGANTINLSAAWTSSSNDVMQLVFNGTSWREASRSVN